MTGPDRGGTRRTSTRRNGARRGGARRGGAAGEDTGDMSFKGVICGVCGELFPRGHLDEDEWCETCGPRMRRRMRWGRHAIAAAITLPFAIWILVWLRRSPELGFLPAYAWALPLAAAYYLGFRIGREVVKGYGRWRRGR